MRIKLRRRFEGQDSWGAFLEEVALDAQGNLAYRKSEGGNCCYGVWEEWQGEQQALEFLLGPASKLMDELDVHHIRVLFAELPDLIEVVELKTTMWGVTRTEINYGEY